MYKDRIEAILRQMEEVAAERDQVGTAGLPGCTSLSGEAVVKVVFDKL